MPNNHRHAPFGRRRTFARPRGTSLVEVTAVISLSTVAAAIAVGLIGLLLRVDRTGRRHLEAMTGLTRLAEQFRRDAATSDEAALSEAAKDRGQRLRLSSAGGWSVEYVNEPARVVRRQRAGDTIAAHEGFILPEKSAALFQLEAGESATFVSITLLPATKSAAAVTRREWRAEAQIGRHRLNRIANDVNAEGATR